MRSIEWCTLCSVFQHFCFLIGLLVPVGCLQSTNNKESSLMEHSRAVNSADSKNKLSKLNGFWDEHHDKNHHQPYFDNSTVTNVTSQLGTTAYLTCKVRQLGDRTVSWVRKRDFHILTSGVYTYTNDQRFHAIHSEGTDDWTLQIKYVQKRDEGMYECQVTWDRGIISLYVALNVVVPKASILGASEYYMKSGSVINLTCVITQSPEPPVYVFWYHNERMINYDTKRGGITVKTDPGEVTTSHLLITNAQHIDSGNYTCSPSTTESISVAVHVLNGDKSAAMQHERQSSVAGLLLRPMSSIEQLCITFLFCVSVFVMR